MDVGLRRAIAVSHLRALPERTLDGLLARAVRTRIPEGGVFHREGEGLPHLELVISGLVRVFIHAPDGRTMTVRYCRPGGLIGVMSLFTSNFAMPATVQALVETDLLRLPPDSVRRSAETDVRVARAFLGEQSERAIQFLSELPGSAFATVRQRVARHLLDLASEVQRTTQGSRPSELVAHISQRELADAVGTVREVVVRVLRDFRESGTIRTERDRIAIVDPAALIREQAWNSGS